MISHEHMVHVGRLALVHVPTLIDCGSDRSRSNLQSFLFRSHVLF